MHLGKCGDAHKPSRLRHLSNLSPVQEMNGSCRFAQINERCIIMTRGSSGAINSSKPNSCHIFNISGPTLRAYSIVNRTSILPKP
jgi:hypothetical protein